jgi:hypothetical protein
MKEAHMRQVQLATRIDRRIKGAVVKVCKLRGQKMNRFIEEALLDKLEELEDIDDIRNIQKEPTRPIEDILKELKLDGLL